MPFSRSNDHAPAPRHYRILLSLKAKESSGCHERLGLVLPPGPRVEKAKMLVAKKTLRASSSAARHASIARVVIDSKQAAMHSFFVPQDHNDLS